MTNGMPPVEPGESIRVVVLSADRVFADSLAAILAGEGLRALRLEPAAAAASGPTEVDVVVLESPGPGDPLWGAAEALRKHDPLVELVVVTSDPDVRDAVETVRSGAFTVLEYPVSGQELAGAVLAAGRRKLRAARRIDQIDHESYDDEAWVQPASSREGRAG